MTWDPNIGLEGIATGLGILGAAVGYVVNLVRNWRRETRDERERGAKFVILQLLEKGSRHGVSEEDLWQGYGAAEAGSVRKKYRAADPDDIDRLTFERFLKQLQNELLIDLVDVDRYRLRFNRASAWEEAQAEARKIRDRLRTKVTPQRVRATASRILRDDTLQAYEKGRAARLLLGLGDDEGADEVIRLLDSKRADVAIEAAEALVGRTFE
jgi:hypothetical protein